MDISVVIPVYRSRDTLEPLVDRLTKVLHSMAANFEMILVNDGSPDDSWQEIERLAHRDRHVRGIDLMRNYGQHNATLCGIKARYEVIFTMDDPANPPEEMPKLWTS
jgi:undecaprenyl-phosphate 4-deoxy-4-formamido-L-arabinose transferase